MSFTPELDTEAPANDRTITRALPLRELQAQVHEGAFGAAYAFVALYGEGRWLTRAWVRAASVEAAVEAAFTRTRQRSVGLPPSHAIVVVPYDYVPVQAATRTLLLSDAHRGVKGVGVWSGAQPLMVSPSETIARNESLTDGLDSLAQRVGIDVERLLAEGRVFSFFARQFHLRLADLEATETFRGNLLVDQGSVTAERIEQFERELSSWMLRNLDPDGRAGYLYLPSRNTQGPGNNMIRQFMASVCLGRVAQRAGSSLPSARAQADANLRYNLNSYYRQEGELGLIQNGEWAYLGSAAMALIAILESPRRAEFATQERGLRATLQSLWQPDGSFRTWLKPSTRDDNQDFFPGETLLAWSLSYAQEPDADLLEKILRSYRYYRTWHLSHRQPAFIPWHTQAYYQLLKVADYPELRAWIFEMNDWLLGMQARSMLHYEDTLGRFYDPEQPFGPPHASSTGVYLEGLADAFSLALEAKDAARIESYRRSILLGLRSSLQLQFRGELDMFYIADANRARGALRTTVYNNKIRIDNVQHTLMAVQKILDVVHAHSLI